MLETYHSNVIGRFVWDLQATSKRGSNGTSWIRTTETPLGVSFEACFRRLGNVLMGPRWYAILRRYHDVPVRCRGDFPLRCLGDIQPRRCWVFHLRRTCDVTETYRRRCYDVATTSCCPMGIKWKKYRLEMTN